MAPHLTELQVTLPERFIGKGNAAAQQSAMKLTELGPRMTLELFKVEQGVNEGDVLYHKFVHKSREEAAKIKSKVHFLLLLLLLLLLLPFVGGVVVMSICGVAFIM
jgi:hypothetical protein